MAFEFVEVQETRGFSESGGKKSATRVFRAWDNDSPLTSPSAVRAYFGSSLPDIGDLFPDETVVFCVSYSMKHIANSRNEWEVTFNYENTEVTGKLPQEEGYTQFTINFAAEFRDFYRVGFTLPSNGTQTGNDCGGQPIDKAGEPLSVLVRLSDLTISETVSAASMPGRIATIRAMRGRRNNAVFQGGAVGKVLYTGATANRIGLEKFSITHKFAEDEYYHMLQSAHKNQLGRVNIEPDAQGVQRATKVELVQPFPQFANFNLLSENF